MVLGTLFGAINTRDLFLKGTFQIKRKVLMRITPK